MTLQRIGRPGLGNQTGTEPGRPNRDTTGTVITVRKEEIFSLFVQVGESHCETLHSLPSVAERTFRGSWCA